MPKPTLADLFAEARTLLECKTVERAVMFSNHNQRAFTSEPDPAYDALRDVTKRMVEYWERAPDGALEGALIKAVMALEADQQGDNISASELNKALDDLLAWHPGNTRIPAMQAVIEWLKGESMTTIFTTKHLTFSELPLRQGRRTKEWSVWNHDYGEQLGIIKWYGPWRQYCFFDATSIYSLGCLQDISTFLQRVAEERTP